jgi:restriction endonuclease Mrr
MVIDLGLDPRHFRLRSAQSAHAEVDLLAEAAHLMFSRWTVQCKRYAQGTNVQLADVAKEVGIAVFAKAHVVVMVTTSDFTSAARAYAEEVTVSMPIQFLFISGQVVNQYLTKGRDLLLEHVRGNAKHVMSLKRRQPLPAKDE